MTIGTGSRVGADVWTAGKDSLLMDAMSEGMSFSTAARAIGVTKDQAKHRFNRLAARMGAQAV